MSESDRNQRLSPARRLLGEVLQHSDIEEPDGRPIYKYRGTTEQYERGRDMLQKFAVALNSDNEPLCAVFAFVTAEWYRREATSLWREWARIGVVPRELAIGERNDIADAGLKWWGQSPIISSQSNRQRREFLLTLALNGGLPSALIVGDTANRVRRFFEGVMGDALGYGASHSIPDLIQIAERHAGALPDSYRDETIYELTAELILELVECRARLPRDRQQANPAAWLDLNDPGWRERLPIHLPDEISACNRLFNELLTIEPRARRGGIGLTRLLCLTKAGDWDMGFLVQANGVLSFDALAGHSEGRFRAFFAGSAARLKSREFAQLYRSSTEQDGTFVVSSQAIGRPSFVGPVAFSETIAVTLSRDGQSLPSVCWPGGRAISSNCYVLKPTDREDRLEIAGTGSVSSPLKKLFILVDNHTSVLAHGDAILECIWQGGAKSLWQVSGMALVETPNGERYRVHAGSQEADERRLDFDQMYFPNISLDDNSILTVESPLRPRCSGAAPGQAASTHMLRVMNGGKKLGKPETAIGLTTVLWQDEEGFIIDRARLLILPAGFSLSGQIEAAGARVSWKRLSGWQLEALDAKGMSLQTLERTKESMLCPWTGSPMAQQRLRLTDLNGRHITLTLVLSSQRVLLVDSEGIIRRDRPDLSVADLRGAYLMAERPALIDLDLRGAANVRALISRMVEGDTPMVRFSDLAQSLLGLSQERGPSVLVQDEFQQTLCTIRRPQEKPSILGDSVHFIRANCDDEIVVARPLLAADEEHAMEATAENCFVLPPHLLGPCLVYRRQGDAVVTRPVVLVRPLQPTRTVEFDAIGRLALIENETTRRAAYNRKLHEITDEVSAGVQISQIVRVINSLRGLSPRALDLTRELANCPALLCRLLLSASSERTEAILELERDLPFLWMALPVSAWEHSARIEWERAKVELASVFGSDEAQKQATNLLVGRMTTLAEGTSWFHGIQKAMGFGGELPGNLSQLAQQHVRLHADQQRPVATILINTAKTIGLPNEITKLTYDHYGTLVAPVILAGLATERITMSVGIAAALRDALDVDQSYISEAFPHCLRHIKS